LEDLKTLAAEKLAKNEKQLTKIHGTLTSPIQFRGEGTQEPYYYSFIRLKGQNIDLPVIFKEKPTNLQKSDELELSGNYSNSNKNVRKSFTAYSYQLLNEKRVKKKCVGGGGTFTQNKGGENIFAKNA